MFGVVDLLWTLVIIGSVAVITIKLRTEIKNDI
jgi:hypothetical protein